MDSPKGCLTDYKLIILIGLPGAGKTSYAKEKYSDCILFDDFIADFCNNKLVNSLNKTKVCITDPRLCIMSVFLQYMDIFMNYISKDDILLVLFEKDIELSKTNVERREGLCSKTNRVINSINYISGKYELDNYNDYNHIVVKSWSDDKIE